jgi:chitinase
MPLAGSTKIISAAVTHMPWKGPDGKPSRNVSEFARYMNFVNIMYAFIVDTFISF